MDALFGRDLSLDLVEKADELLMPMLLHAAPDELAFEHVEGGKQGGGAVALVVVCHGGGASLLEGQTRLGAIERLDSGLGLASLVHDLIGAEPVCTQQDDLSPPHLLLRHVAIPHERLQTETVGRSNDDGNTRSHASDSHAIGSSGIPQGIQMSDLIH
jgi:hypothetical protein